MINISSIEHLKMRMTLRYTAQLPPCSLLSSLIFISSLYSHSAKDDKKLSMQGMHSNNHAPIFYYIVRNLIKISASKPDIYRVSELPYRDLRSRENLASSILLREVLKKLFNLILETRYVNFE